MGKVIQLGIIGLPQNTIMGMPLLRRWPLRALRLGMHLRRGECLFDDDEQADAGRKENDKQ